MTENLSHPNQSPKIFKSWVIWAIAALFPMYQFMLQGSPSVMLNNLTEDLSISLVGASFITTFFFFSYIIMQIPAGILVDIYGPRMLLVLGSFLAGTACMIFSISKALWMAEFSRLIMGFVSSPGIVSVFFLVSQWFKPKQFALLVGLTETLGLTGAALITVLLSATVEWWGWRTAVFLCGVLGIIISILILLIVRNKPKDTSFVADKAHHFSLKYEVKNLKIVVGRFQVWAAGLYMGLVFSIVPAFFALWGILFFMRTYEISSTQAATINALALIGAGIGGPFLGWLSDKIKRRKAIMIFASLSSLILLWIILHISMPMHLAFLCNFWLGFSCSGYVVAFAVIKEILPKEVKGKAMGFANMLCLSLGAPVIQPVIAFLFKCYACSEHIFRHALNPLLVALGLSFILTFFIKETYCKDVSTS